MTSEDKMIDASLSNSLADLAARIRATRLKSRLADPPLDMISGVP